MTARKDLKNRIQEHMDKTGKSYTAARRDVLADKLCPVCNSEIETREVQYLSELDDDATEGQFADHLCAVYSEDYGEWGVGVQEPYCPKCELKPAPAQHQRIRALQKGLLRKPSSSQAKHPTTINPQTRAEQQQIGSFARLANRAGTLLCPFCGTAGCHYDEGDGYCPQCKFPRWSSQEQRKNFYATQPTAKFFCVLCDKSYKDNELNAPGGFDCGACYRSFSVSQAKRPQYAKGERLCVECDEVYIPTQADQRTCSEWCEQCLEMKEDL